MGISSGIGGLVGGLAGLFGGGGAGSVQPPPTPLSFQSQQLAGSNAFQGMQNYQNVYGNLGQSTLPYAQNIFQSLYGNPYAGQAQAGANQAAGLGMNAALQSYGAGGQLLGQGQQLLPYAQNIMQAGFDPQNALYAQTANATQNQANAINAAAGVATTPYGANVADNTMANFNINWQNQQLAREAQAAGAAGGLVGAAGGAINQGAGIMNTAPGQFATAAAMPYSTAYGIGQGQQTALTGLQGAYGGAAGLDNTANQNWLAYLAAGNAANQTANQQFQTLLNQNQMQYQQNMGYGNALGAGLANLGKGWGNTSSSPLWSGSAFG